MNKFFDERYENNHFEKNLLVFARFDLPTRKVFTDDLQNKRSGRYFKESEKIKNVFILKMMNISPEYTFQGIEVDFYEKNNERINYAWAVLTAKYSKKIEFEEPKNPEEISADLYLKVYEKAKDCIRSGSAVLFKTRSW